MFFPISFSDRIEFLKPNRIRSLAMATGRMLLFGSLIMASFCGAALAQQFLPLKPAPESGMKLVFPLPDPARGKHVFVNKGCVICHSVNNVGGKAAPPLDTVPGNRTIEPYKFIGRMWRGATAMIQLQNMELGYRIDFTGEEIGHVIGFLSSAAEQKSFTAQDIPDLIREIIINEANQWMKKQGEAEK